jgi:hypothetical protein
VAETDELIDKVLSGQTTSRQHLVSVQAVFGAIPLKTAGGIGGWQERLRTYPETLAERIVAEATDFWRAPHHIETLWALADRGQVFSLVEWLQADIQDALRLLFAINRRWEPDWKWLSHHLSSLSLVPERLAERIESVFQHSDPHQAVADTLEIVEDVLRLASAEFAVSAQLANIRTARRLDWM